MLMGNADVIMCCGSKAQTKTRRIRRWKVDFEGGGVAASRVKEVESSMEEGNGISTILT